MAAPGTTGSHETKSHYLFFDVKKLSKSMLYNVIPMLEYDISLTSYIRQMSAGMYVHIN